MIYSLPGIYMYQSYVSTVSVYNDVWIVDFSFLKTRSVEASAAHEAKRVEQVAKRDLERQKLLNEKEAEKEQSYNEVIYQLSHL